MKNSVYLRFSSAVLQLLQGMCILALILMLYDGVRHTIDPDFYFVQWEWYGLSGDLDFVEEGAYPSQTNFSYYFNWIQISIQLILIFIMWNTLSKVLKSVSSFKTFIEANSEHFRRVGHILFALFFLNMFHFFQQSSDDDLRVVWDADFSIIFFALGAYVLAMVFKEGKQLAEDQNLIV